MENRKIIIDNIINITLNNINIEISSLDLEYSLNKYSAKKNNIWHIIFNNKHLSKKDKFIITYKCITCSSIHSIGTTQFIRKINKCSINCYFCRNKNEEKRNYHSDFMKNNFKEKIAENKLIKENINIKDPINIRDISINLFNEYDNDFKENYFKFHLTDLDYQRISKNIISFHNTNLSDVNNYEYWSIIKINNQMNFTSMVYDKINNILFKAHQPILKCDNCSLHWRAKSLEKFKNSIKILCKDCSLVNNTFKLRVYHNCNNEQILYESKLELKFIKWCNDNKIIVYNGPKIPYIFENIERSYRIDFRINNNLIEIKDNHIWHKNDIKSGKWTAKELAVNNLLQNEEYKNYFFINPFNWLIQLNKIYLLIYK
jgi:hypothetical protein